jgi:DNA repair protein RecN (Recombination protein N)
MLDELIVENLLLLERAELRLAPGLNVLTGETGAGKTMLAHALDLLLGGKARTGIVRPGAAEAYVEGIFELPDDLPDELRELVPERAEELVLARRVWPDGRTRAYVGGRSATVADLRELSGRLLSFYGQHEHRRLMLSTAQLDILDAHCGPAQLERRGRIALQHARVRELEAQISELRELAGARDRELDLLAFELDEIAAAAPSEEEMRELTLERERLRHLEALRSAAAAAGEAVSPDAGGGAAELLAAAVRGLEPLAGVDPALGALTERLSVISYEAQDVGAELRRYALESEAQPGRLEEVEERLALLARLERKHGGSIAAVLEHAERCRARQDELERAEVALEEGEAELVRALAARDELDAGLREARRSGAPELADAVHRRLASLAMEDARFEVVLREREGGCGPRGADTVELMIAPNPGVPAAPLRETASGGELSRVMLALLSAAHAVDDAGEGPARQRHAPSLVFDEIDAGIGGHTARAVGEHLKALAGGRQILCITHLPQVASLADRHFRIEKSSAGGTARTTVVALSGDEVVGELVRMLGAGEGDRAASQHARRLLRAA